MLSTGYLVRDSAGYFTGYSSVRLATAYSPSECCLDSVAYLLSLLDCGASGVCLYDSLLSFASLTEDNILIRMLHIARAWRVGV